MMTALTGAGVSLIMLGMAVFMIVRADILIKRNTEDDLPSKQKGFLIGIDDYMVKPIEQATKLARGMISRYGMSDDFGMVALETVTNQYLGGDTSLACSERTASRIDDQVMQVVKNARAKADRILQENEDKLHELAEYLIEKETITGEEFMEILKNNTKTSV